ncbi:pentatricopeptide repeat-containing protein At5g03800-like [Chenopodium quinoa]|uniref:pentatricopeptide repeat-containing protein At5g03800-like n=1 Tax=Chenopodium quinoa TaxID=63459 RepID=UPI000B772F37|nr:pentatricopeptide repeat-containing protein At5g03800-like [Chenopodium quinoa]
MASTSSPPQLFLSPLLHPPPLQFPPKFIHSSSISLSKSNTFATSAAQFLTNSQISPVFQQPHLPFSSQNTENEPFSLEDAQILYHKCLELLKLSARYADAELVIAVHTLIVKLGEDNYLLNSLITAYLKLGLLDDAFAVFKGMSNPDVVSYTAMISGFAKSGYEFDAIGLFMKMRKRGIEPNEFTFVAFLTACSRISGLQLGFQIHSLVVKLGYLFSVYVANSLTGLYSRCGFLDNALQVFDEMPQRDIASWNTVISSVVDELMYDRAFELFHEMVRVDRSRANHITLSSLISACAGSCAQVSGREIHGHALKMGFDNNLSVSNSLIGFYTKCGTAKHVQALFERMPIKDVISWTAMITAYMEFGRIELALDIFKKMPERNSVTFNAVLAGLCLNSEGLGALSLFCEIVNRRVELTENTLTSVISACSLLGEKKISEQIHGFVIKFGCKSNACIEAALVDMCTRCGRMTDAQKMFQQSQYDQNLSIKWTSLISGYARDAQPEEAMTLFKWGQSEQALTVDEVVATAVLGICGTLGFNEMGEQMHCHALKSGHLYDVRLGNAVISMYSKCGYMEDAWRVFNLLPMHDVVSWNCLIAGHLLLREGDKVLAVWSRMKREHIRPDLVTLIQVISSYRHTKLNMLDDCRRLFFSLTREYDVELTSDHYASFVSVLGEWGFLEEAEDIISKMPFEPKSSVWRALLHSCNLHSDSIAGKRIAKHILDMQPEDPSTYILISNLLSASGRWHCSELVRDEMRRKGIRKHPARSWIAHNNKVHAFFTRDKTHPQSKDIYSGLEILILECLKSGYVPDTSFVLHEVEEHQKKEFLFYHSAKLAVTYGLLMTTPGRPIRVTKNVLLCGDCHNFLKYVSRVTRREICVRDTSGFHCFSNGKCSCKDHW